MTQYMLEKQREEMWERQKEENKQTYVSSMKGLLRPKPRKREKTILDVFRDCRFNIRQREDGKRHSLDRFNVWDVVSENGSIEQLCVLYDIVYPLYLEEYITPEQWCAFENLYDHRYYEIYEKRD